MKITCLDITLACTLCVAYLTAAEAPQIFTGVITDTMCGDRPHSNMMKDKTEAECVRQCAHGPYVYAVSDGTNVMKLSDQKKPAKYAGQKVRVTGVYDEKSKTLKVASIEPATGN
jgi:hypothetical protein